MSNRKALRNRLGASKSGGAIRADLAAVGLALIIAALTLGAVSTSAERNGHAPPVVPPAGRGDLPEECCLAVGSCVSTASR